MTCTVLSQTHKWRSFKEDLAAHIWFRDGGVHREGAEYDHLKRFRKRLNGAMTIESNQKYLDAVLELLGLEGAKDVPTPSVPAHEGKAHGWRIAESSRDHSVQTVCWRFCSTTRTTEQMHSTRCQFWDRCWNNRLKDR